MKKVLLLSMFLLILASAIFAANPRTAAVWVTSPVVDLLASGMVTSTTANATDYVVSVYIADRTTEVISTTTHPAATIKLYKWGAGTVAAPYTPALYVNYAGFTTPWSTTIAEPLHWTVTYNGAGIHQGESVSFTTVGPIGTSGYVLKTPLMTVPPLVVTDPNPTLATIGAPANGAVNVLQNTSQVSWSYAHNDGYTDPANYKVYFGTDNPPTTLLTTVAGGPGSYSANLGTLNYATTYYWQVVPTTVSGKAVTRGLAVNTSGRQALKPSKGDAVNSPVWSFTTEAAPITDHQVTINSNIPGVKIFKDGILQNTNPVIVTDGATATFVVQNIPTMVTPLPQTVTVNSDMTLTFTYESIPVVGVTYGSTVVTPAQVTAAAPVTVPAASGNFNFVFTPQAAGLIVFTVKQPDSMAKINTNVYAGYQNVWRIFSAYVDDSAILNGTDYSITYTEDFPYEVAINWGAWYPHTGPWSGYLFNNGPATSLSQPLTAFGANSHYVNAAVNELTVGPLPTIAAGAATLELVLNDGDHTLPVELTHFDAVATAQMFVNLQWVTASETNNLGFNVLRSDTDDINTATRINLNLIAGTNSESQHSYYFLDQDVVANTTYYYWLESVSMSGTSEFSTSVNVRVEGQTPTPVPTVTSISKAYPNPFSMTRSTTLNVEVKANDKATVTVYNILGQAVRTWTLATGSHKLEWNGRDSKGNALGCGVYFAKMSSSSANKTVKMVIVK